MDRYIIKVSNPKPESPVNENEIRITSQGLLRNYITYAITLLQFLPQERQVNEIVLKATGQAISKTVAMAEILKRRIPQLHQYITTSSVKITDTFEPIEEGLQTLDQTRHVPMISITLSMEELNLNKNSPGSQSPSQVDQTKQQNNYRRQHYNYPPPHEQLPPRHECEMYDSSNGGVGYGRGIGGVTRAGYSRGRGRMGSRPRGGG
ncbi:PREDICTED: ribonuclease P protein subunit p25-like protein [Erythranthe guttata]|uniref:ribonuclease P protein subunit p25-like protein n=1 Tax=Erythranthe guttata TaxID=4155 RepID=UPI00064DEBC4|nr:PREDICTED: ribonuclease P protein subunit p25-like protein [Erythranthe guttata]|eukprot:XP_012835739.1 PREDICTED: ribonuclease P protein subunit p25-like protein [Erythranthe guttata]